MDYELYHYGVMGMKWGVRKAARQDTRSLRKKRKEASRELSRATDRYNHTWFGKNRRQAVKDRLSEAQSKYEKIDAEYKNAYAKAKQRASEKIHKTAGYDKKTAARVTKMSTGKALAQSFLMGSYGALKYNEAKSRGANTGAAVAKGILYNSLNNMSLGRLAAEDGIRQELKKLDSKK